MSHASWHVRNSQNPLRQEHGLAYYGGITIYTITLFNLVVPKCSVW